MPAESSSPTTEPAARGLLALLCRAGRHLCALPLAHVRETMRPLPLTPIPGAPSFVAGAARIRGVPTPVLHVAGLLDGSTPASVTRFVTLDVNGRGVALALDHVLGIRDLPLDQLGRLPPLLASSGSDAVARLGVLDRELLLVLEAARLVPEPVWSGLDLGGPA